MERPEEWVVLRLPGEGGLELYFSDPTLLQNGEALTL
jgi:hypothetical protein